MQNVRIVQAQRPLCYKSPFSDEEHTLLIVSTEPNVTVTERKLIAAEIIAQNCRYALCWGIESADWEHAIDRAALEADGFSDSQDHFLMTTSHPDEPIDDVVHFLRNCAFYEDYESTNIVVFLVGENSVSELELRNALIDHSLIPSDGNDSNTKDG